MNSTCSEDGSLCPSAAGALAGLTDEQRERLTLILDRYLAALERSEPLSQAAIAAEHPDLAEALGVYFGSLEALHDMAAGFQSQPVEEEPASAANVAGRIGDFELVREIGRGGMGVVHEARQISLNRRVALKLLPFAAVLEARQIARFKHEAQAAAQLQHPHIVPVFAIGVERGIHYYAMQLIDGQPLDRAIAELRDERDRRARGVSPPVTSHSQTGAPGRSRLPLDDRNHRDYYRVVIDLGIQAAEALHAAHEYGVVHRDIKPSNLLLDQSGKLWVTDFGLARMGRAAALTRTGDLVGTMRYMSPEQAAGRSTMIDHRTDIYSLGATLYELLTLRAAFAGESGPELLRQIEQRDPPLLRELRPDIPADLETVVQKAMSGERDGRYATAQDFAADLRAVLEGRPTEARPPTVIERVARWGRRNGRGIAAAAVALSIAVAGLTVGAAIVVREQAQAAASDCRAERHFREAREVLDQFGLQLSARLAEVPGAEAIRRDLLRETAQYYRRCIQSAGNDAAARAALAAAYGRLALVLDDAGSAQEAAEAHSKAVSIWTRAAAGESNNRDFERQLALCRNNYGLALARAGDPKRARQEFHLAIGILRRLAEPKRPADDLRLELGAALCNLGQLEQRDGNEADARAAFGEAIVLLSTERVGSPADPERLQKLAAAVNNLAATHLDPNPREAQALYQRALQHQVAALRLRPEENALTRDLSLTLNNLGAACGRARDFAQAIEYYRYAIDLQEKLVTRMPAQLTYQRDLAVSLNNLGLALSRNGQRGEAEQSFRRSLALYAAIVEEVPGDAGSLSDLTSVHNNFGIVMEQSGQVEAATAGFAAAVDGHDDLSRAALARHASATEEIAHP